MCSRRWQASWSSPLRYWRRSKAVRPTLCALRLVVSAEGTALAGDQHHAGVTVGFGAGERVVEFVVELLGDGVEALRRLRRISAMLVGGGRRGWFRSSCGLPVAVGMGGEEKAPCSAAGRGGARESWGQRQAAPRSAYARSGRTGGSRARWRACASAPRPCTAFRNASRSAGRCGGRWTRGRTRRGWDRGGSARRRSGRRRSGSRSSRREPPGRNRASKRANSAAVVVECSTTSVQVMKS